MTSPEERDKHRRRIKIRSKIAKSLQSPKYKQQIVEDSKKIQKLSHREFIELLQEDIDDIN